MCGFFPRQTKTERHGASRIGDFVDNDTGGKDPIGAVGIRVGIVASHDGFLGAGSGSENLAGGPQVVGSGVVFGLFQLVQSVGLDDRNVVVLFVSGPSRLTGPPPCVLPVRVGVFVNVPNEQALSGHFEIVECLDAVFNEQVLSWWKVGVDPKDIGIDGRGSHGVFEPGHGDGGLDPSELLARPGAHQSGVVLAAVHAPHDAHHVKASGASSVVAGQVGDAKEVDHFVSHDANTGNAVAAASDKGRCGGVRAGPDRPIAGMPHVATTGRRSVAPDAVVAPFLAIDAVGPAHLGGKAAVHDKDGIELAVAVRVVVAPVGNDARFVGVPKSTVGHFVVHAVQTVSSKGNGLLVLVTNVPIQDGGFHTEPFEGLDFEKLFDATSGGHPIVKTTVEQGFEIFLGRDVSVGVVTELDHDHNDLEDTNGGVHVAS